MQQSPCVEEHLCGREAAKGWRKRAISFFSAKLAACVIYSIVFTAWLFTALHFGLDWSVRGCACIALGVGLLMGIGIFLFVKELIAA